MSTPRIYLFDDRAARGWEPFALTRPGGELLAGTLTGRERAGRRFGAPCAGHITSDHLVGFEEPDCAPVANGGRTTDGGRIFLSSRTVPAWGPPPDIGGDSAPILIGDRPVGWYSPPGADDPPEAFFLDPENASGGGRPIRLDGAVFERPWDLIDGLADRIALDIESRAAEARPVALPAGAHRIGDHAILCRGAVEIEPGVVFDVREGPVWLEDGVRIRAFTRLAGPAFIGAGTTLLGGSLDTVAIGPVCKVRGEVEASIVLGYANKAHDGFLGHAYLGRWTNLGALTTNSDLKNNYGPVRVRTADGETETGLSKLGCLLGDHVKTGIGTLLTTGCVVGAGSNVFGGAMPPPYVPPFSWGTGERLGAYDIEKFLATAATVMARRKVELTDGHRAALRAAWRIGRERVGTDGA